MLSLNESSSSMRALRNPICEISEVLKDVMEHETHFIPNLMGEGLNALAMWIIRRKGWLVIGSSVGSGGGLVHLGVKSSSVFTYGCVRRKGWLVIGSSVGSGGGLVHLGVKSSSVFTYGCGEVGGVVKMSSQGAKGKGSFG
nr:hypothetical protein [Tanacetum cinerariifolium]